MEPPSLHDQFEEIIGFVMQKCDEEAKLILTHAGDMGAPACEMGQGKIIRKLDPTSCACDQCLQAREKDVAPLKQCIFCHYAYYEKPSIVYGLFGVAFVTCPNCRRNHSWEYIV